MVNDASRTQRWAAPKRPEWVSHINEEGACMDIKGVVPLDENSLLNTARANTGLKDFGDDNWYEPFRVLIRSFDDESQLNLMGRLMTRSDILSHLEARLHIENTYKQHPEIEDEEIKLPLVIIGQGRTGTSVLQNMLSQAPDNGTTLHWESLFPYPPPAKANYCSDPRIEKADKLIKQVYRVVPEMAAMHEFGAEIPIETILLDALSFRSPGWFNYNCGQVPSYNEYMATQDDVLIFEYQKRALKYLQWKNPRKHWVLKSPAYLQHMTAMLKVYPDAGFIWTHRDPVKALASTINITGTAFYCRSDAPFIGGALDAFTDAELCGEMLASPIAWLESGAVPKERLCNIQYQDFIANPLNSAQAIYNYFGIAMSNKAGEAMQRYMTKNPRSSRPSHQYAAGDQSQIETERKAYARYQQYFNVPNEL